MSPHPEKEQEEDVDNAQVKLNSPQLFEREVFKDLISDVSYLLESQLACPQIELLTHRVHVLIVFHLIILLLTVDHYFMRPLR